MHLVHLVQEEVSIFLVRLREEGRPAQDLNFDTLKVKRNAKDTYKGLFLEFPLSDVLDVLEVATSPSVGRKRRVGDEEDEVVGPAAKLPRGEGGAGADAGTHSPPRPQVVVARAAEALRVARQFYTEYASSMQDPVTLQIVTDPYRLDCCDLYVSHVYTLCGLRCPHCRKIMIQSSCRPMDRITHQIVNAGMKNVVGHLRLAVEVVEDHPHARNLLAETVKAEMLESWGLSPSETDAWRSLVDSCIRLRIDRETLSLGVYTMCYRLQGGMTCTVDYLRLLALLPGLETPAELAAKFMTPLYGPCEGVPLPFTMGPDQFARHAGDEADIVMMLRACTAPILTEQGKLWWIRYLLATSSGFHLPSFLCRFLATVPDLDLPPIYDWSLEEVVVRSVLGRFLVNHDVTVMSEPVRALLCAWGEKDPSSFARSILLLFKREHNLGVCTPEAVQDFLFLVSRLFAVPSTIHRQSLVEFGAMLPRLLALDSAKTTLQDVLISLLNNIPVSELRQDLLHPVVERLLQTPQVLHTLYPLLKPEVRLYLLLSHTNVLHDEIEGSLDLLHRANPHPDVAAELLGHLHLNRHHFSEAVQTSLKTRLMALSSSRRTLPAVAIDVDSDTEFIDI